MLYIFCILHQTTTLREQSNALEELYIFCILHQTTTTALQTLQRLQLYIFCILHQTTTYRFKSTDFQCLTITFSNKKWRVGYIS